MLELDALLDRFTELDEDAKVDARAEIDRMTQGMKWTPNPGRQTEAYISKADVLLYGGRAGGGKAISINELLPTPYGWSTMGEIEVGDQIFDRGGSLCRVAVKSPIIMEDTYRVMFSDGSEIIAGARHRWVTSTYRERMRIRTCSEEAKKKRRERRPLRGKGKRPDLAARNSREAKSKNLPLSGIRTTAEISETLLRYDGGLNHSISVAGSLQTPEAILLIEPYVLGAWLGDGTSTQGAIAGIDEEIFAEVANSYTISRHANPYIRGVLGLVVDLRKLGVLGNKHIPAAYLRASHDQRLALLNGLMDTDGYCDKRGQCEIQLTRKTLIDGVQELIHSLGIKVEMREGKATLYGRYISQKWRLKFMTDLPAFRMSRKLIRQKRSGFRGTHENRYITSCDQVDRVPLQCIQVDSPTHCYLAGRSMIPTHNTHLELGLGINESQNGIIFRRKLSQLDGLEREGKMIIGTDARYNGQDHEWNWPGGKTLKLGGMKDPDSWMDHAGRERDFIAFDEAGEFLEKQVASILAWLRAAPGTRTRMILGSNPPRTTEGIWMMEWFAPWLDEKFPNKAKPGELRWAIYVTDEHDDSQMVWVDGPGEHEIDDEIYIAKSYTFIPASLTDNPFRNTPEYIAQLQSLPEPLRSQLLYGDFSAGMKDNANQCIPTEWVRLAMSRRKPHPPEGVPMCAIGVDCSGGGSDPMVQAARYDGWYADFLKTPAKDIPAERAGAYAAGMVISYRRDNALVIVDLGGGYGGPLYEHLKDNEIECQGYKGAEASTRRSADSRLGFTNTRSAAYWGFREALDPSQPGGSPIQLPDDARLLAGLTAPTFEVTPNGIKVEPKVTHNSSGKVMGGVMAKLGFSPDESDSVIMAWHYGAKESNSALEWYEAAQRKRVRHPKVVLGGHTPTTARRR